MRAVVSVEPPGGNGKISVIGRVGKDCAEARPAHAASAVATISFIIFLLPVKRESTSSGEIPVRLLRRADRRHRLAGGEGRPRGAAVDPEPGGARHRRRLRARRATTGSRKSTGRTWSCSTTSLGMGTLAEELRGRGKPVVGGSPYTDRLEDDRAFGQTELKAVGVRDHPAGELHFVRRGGRVRAGEPEPLRDQAERRGAEHQAAALRRRGGRRRATSSRCCRTTSAPGRTR